MESLFYHPSRTPPIAPPGVEEVRFKTSDGLTLHGWLLKPSAPPASGKLPLILHCHGNAGNIEDHLAFSEFLPLHGVAVFLFDYRGYGLSDDARPSRDRLMIDTRAALDAMLARPDIDPRRIGALGVSLGGVFASNLAAERQEIRSVALVAPFSGWSRIASDHLPVLGALLIRPGLDPVDAVTKLGQRPLLVVHGQQDTIVPPRHGERIVRAAAGAGVPAKLLPLPHAGHNDVLDDASYEREITEFFTRTLATGS